jgi:bacteriorhodopsin
MSNTNSHHPVPPPDGEKQHIFDKPENVTRLLRVFYFICFVLIAIEFWIHRHTEHVLETIFGFYGLYGFIACVILVLIATQMRKLLMRSENFYEEGDNDDQ